LPNRTNASIEPIPALNFWHGDQAAHSLIFWTGFPPALAPMHCASCAIVALRELDCVVSKAFVVEFLVWCWSDASC